MYPLTSLPPLAIARIAIGLYLVVHYLHLLPFSAELYSSAGMLGDPALNPGAAGAISPLYLWDSPAVVRGLVVGLVALAAAYTLGFRTRTVGVLLGLGSLFLWQRNMLTLNPSLPFLGFWFVVQAFADPAPPLSIDRALARRRGAPRTADVLPDDVAAALWLVFTVAYGYSGWTKLVSPSWRSGEAVGWMLAGPIGLDHPLARFVAELPHPLLALATWGVVAVELLAPIALWPVLRRPWWWLVLGMHLGLVCLVDLQDVSWGMVVVHLALWPSRGLRALRVGDAAVRHGTTQSPESSKVPGKLSTSQERVSPAATVTASLRLQAVPSLCSCGGNTPPRSGGDGRKHQAAAMKWPADQFDFPSLVPQPEPLDVNLHVDHHRGFVRIVPRIPRGFVCSGVAPGGVSVRDGGLRVRVVRGCARGANQHWE